MLGLAEIHISASLIDACKRALEEGDLKPRTAVYQAVMRRISAEDKDIAKNTKGYTTKRQLRMTFVQAVMCLDSI